MFQQILQWLTWVAFVAVPIAVVDDWFLRPRRRIAALPAVAQDPAWLRAMYAALPVTIIGAILHMLQSERLDFSLVLVLVITVAGVVWVADWLVGAPLRARAAQARGVGINAIELPITVDYAHSFLPVFLLVLVIRSFIFEPFRIPSDSMMPTLQDGDFIAVNKFAYGLRLPVVNTIIVPVGTPQRGDVVVFRYPPDPSQNYIKRLVGLPGDRVAVKDDQLIINGTPVPLQSEGRYNDGCYQDMRLATEQLGEHRHRTLACLTPGGLAAAPVASCNRQIGRSYQCDEPNDPLLGDSNDFAEVIVPAGHYLMIGDNRDNSADGRIWGFVPDANIIGRAARIWFNWDLGRSGGPQWSRVGRAIE